MTSRPLSASWKRLLERATAECEAALDAEGVAYLKARAFDRATTERFRLGRVPDDPGTEELARFIGRLSIPAIGPHGNVYSIRFRCIEDHDCKEAGHGKYDSMAGVQTRLFNLRALAEADDELVITEGEIDAVSCEMAGLHAVGVPGVNNWKRHHKRLFAGFSKLIVLGDNDDAGRAFVKRVTADCPWASVRLSQRKDVNEVLQEEGPDAVRRLARGADD